METSKRSGYSHPTGSTLIITHLLSRNCVPFDVAVDPVCCSHPRGRHCSRTYGYLAVGALHSRTWEQFGLAFILRSSASQLSSEASAATEQLVGFHNLASQCLGRDSR